MKMASFLTLSTILFLVGCQTTGGPKSKPASSVLVSNTKDWVFPVSFKKGSRLPRGFKQVETQDGCTLFFFDPAEYEDVTLITHFKPNYGKNDFGGGLLFRYKNPRNYYCLRFNSNTNNLRFYKSIRGDRARFANHTVRIKDKNSWHKLKVVARGDLLQAYVNDKLIFSREDELIKKGKVGLWVRGENPKTEFADLTIQP